LDQTRFYDDSAAVYQNYVPPNLAPRAVDAGAGRRPLPVSWQGAPPPPPDPIGVLFRYLIQRPGIAFVLAYSVWLVMWSLYAMQALGE
jgi:hypothetical protein